MRTLNLKWMMVALAFLVCSKANLPAASRYWQNTSGGIYGNGSNWVGGVPPATSDTASFTSNATYTVTFTESTNAYDALFNASAGADVTIDLGGYAWTNSNRVYVGDGASSNIVTVIGGGILHGGQVVNGYSGTVNRLVVLNGSLVANGHYWHGFYPGANGNQLVIDGAAARMETLNFDLTIGKDGNSNSLIVTNGGYVSSKRDIGLGGTPGASGTGRNNLGHVTGPTSWVEAREEFFVGQRGSENQLTIDDGGHVVAVLAGYVGGAAGANSNRVLISGGTWSNSANFFVGEAGACGNSVTVSNGGILYVASYLWLGGNSGAASNNTLEVLDGTVTPRGHLVVGNVAGARDNRVTVDGTASVVRTENYDITIGKNGDLNTLTVQNGGRVYVKRNIGFGGQPNMAGTGFLNEGLVTGAGSLLLVTNELYVGGTGSLNTLRIEDGAMVSNGNAYVGSDSGANGNWVYVSRGVWSNLNLNVGRRCSGNGVSISNTGQLQCSYLLVGEGGETNRVTVDSSTCVVSNHVKIGSAGGTNNVVMVTGADSLLQVSRFDLAVGTDGDNRNLFGDGNQMIITNGATVTFMRKLYVGGNGGASNVLYVTGGGILESSDTGTAGEFVAGTNSDNRIVNDGGIYQFASGTPTMTPGTFGRISIRNGTLSFRGITNADVFCNGSARPFDSATKVDWSGENAFRLDCATNLSAQAYTFVNTMGPTNFAQLELFNAAQYSGAITIGSGGSLSVHGGPSSTDSNLTMQSAGRIIVDLAGTNGYSRLDVTGSVDLGNSTLEVTLQSDPLVDYEYKIISATGGLGGTMFNSAEIQSVYAGKPVYMNVRYEGNDVILARRSRGTVVLVK